jgi:hypothetical protein
VTAAAVLTFAAVVAAAAAASAAAVELLLFNLQVQLPLLLTMSEPTAAVSCLSLLQLLLLHAVTAAAVLTFAAVVAAAAAAAAVELLLFNLQVQLPLLLTMSEPTAAVSTLSLLQLLLPSLRAAAAAMGQQDPGMLPAIMDSRMPAGGEMICYCVKVLLLLYYITG